MGSTPFLRAEAPPVYALSLSCSCTLQNVSCFAYALCYRIRKRHKNQLHLCRFFDQLHKSRTNGFESGAQTFLHGRGGMHVSFLRGIEYTI